jgi:hypothetical protein
MVGWSAEHTPRHIVTLQAVMCALAGLEHVARANAMHTYARWPPVPAVRMLADTRHLMHGKPCDVTQRVLFDCCLAAVFPLLRSL